jgi:hypothetical protein
MYNVPEEDRKIFLEYLAKRPYIEVAALIARIAAWKKGDKKEDKRDNGKDKAQ